MKISTFKDFSSKLANILIKSDLILVDLDDVVMTTDQYLCSSAWYYRYLVIKHHYISDSELMLINSKCLTTTNYKAVDLELNQYVSKLANEGKIVIGFTARGLFLSEDTLVDIKSCNISFSNIEISHPHFKEGVLFCGVSSQDEMYKGKGKILKEVLELDNFKNVTSIAMIDDYLKNHREVYENLKNTDFEITHIHLTKIAEQTFQSYTQDQLDKIGEYQLNVFELTGVIPSNQMAYEASFISEL